MKNSKAYRGVISPNDLPRLKRLYEKAVQDGKAEFQFNGNEIVTSYAKYLIEYLESLKAKGK